MADGPDGRAFDVVTTPFNANAPEFGEVARKIATADTLDGFLRDIRAKFSDSPPAPQAAPSPPPGPRAAVQGDQPG